MHLYEHSQQLLDFLDVEDEFDPEVAKDQLEALEGEFDDKVIACGFMVLEIKKNADAIDAELERLQERQKAYMDRLDWLKSYIKGHMTAVNKKRVETPALTVRRQKNSAPSTIITDESKVSKQYEKTRTETSWNKTLMAESWDEMNDDEKAACGFKVVRGDHLRVG